MKRAYQIILAIVSLALVAALLIGLFVKQKDEPENGQTDMTTYTTEQTTLPEQTEGETTVSGESTVDTAPETTAAEIPTIDNQVTFPDTEPEETQQETTLQTTAPTDPVWTGGGILLPDDNWED